MEAAAATSRRQAAARFGVGIATSIRWMAALAATGTVAPRPQGRTRRSKLDPHEAFLRDLIAKQDDITLEEMRARLLAARGLTVGLGTLWSFLDARGLTYKKRAIISFAHTGLAAFAAAKGAASEQQRSGSRVHCRLACA